MAQEPPVWNHQHMGLSTVVNASSSFSSDSTMLCQLPRSPDRLPLQGL